MLWERELHPQGSCKYRAWVPKSTTWPSRFGGSNVWSECVCGEILSTSNTCTWRLCVKIKLPLHEHCTTKSMATIAHFLIGEWCMSLAFSWDFGPTHMVGTTKVWPCSLNFWLCTEGSQALLFPFAPHFCKYLHDMLMNSLPWNCYLVFVSALNPTPCIGITLRVSRDCTSSFFLSYFYLCKLWWETLG